MEDHQPKRFYGNDAAPWIPTLEEIALAARAIQATWSPEERMRRAGLDPERYLAVLEVRMADVGE